MHKLLITSAAMHEGKSTVCKKLAKEKADSGERVLLMDMDIRESIRLGQGNGIADYVRSRGRIGADIVKEDNYEVLLPAKFKQRRFFHTTEIRFFEKLLMNLETQYDTAIIDTPPMWCLPDTFFLCRYCDEIIVVRSGRVDTEKALQYFKEKGFQPSILDNIFTPPINKSRYGDKSPELQLHKH